MGKLFQRGVACIVDGCGSSDGAAIYKDEDTDETYQICFSASCPSEGKATFINRTDSVREATVVEEQDDTGVSKLVLAMRSYGNAVIPDGYRGLSHNALSQYGVKQNKDVIYFPYFDDDGDLTAFKIRRPPKKFSVIGNSPKELLFGKQAFKPGGKAVTVVEGELDAVSVYEMFGCKYPVVSSSNTSSIIDCLKANYEWLNTFDSIYICMDADAAGQKQVKEIAGLFSGKSKVVSLDRKLKDPNGYLMAGKSKEFIDTWWKAIPYTPDGIVRGDSLWERMKAPRSVPVAMWPWTMLNEYLYGIYPGRIYTWTAGSGVGKSQVIRELSYWILKETKSNIGILMLEEATEDTVLGMMSIHLSKPLHVPGTKYTEEEYHDAYTASGGSDRVFYHDHFGSTSITNILDRVRYLAKAESCKFIFLDHLSILVSAQQNPDERKAIDEIMTKLRMLVEETGITLFLVSHLKRSDGKDYTRGAEVSASDLRGSASIEQLSDTIIALERNGHADTEEESNTTILRVIKSRQFGRLGQADALYYNRLTGRMKETRLVDTL